MTGLEIRLEGYEHARATLDKYEARQLRNRLKRAVTAGGRMVRDAQRAAAPIGNPATDPRSGETRRQIKVMQMSSGGVRIGPTAPGSHNPAWAKITAVVYGRKRGNHGTTRPHDFVGTGSRAVRSSVVRIIRDAAVRG